MLNFRRNAPFYPDRPSPIRISINAERRLAAEHLMVATPCHGGQVHAGYMRSALELADICAKTGLNLSIVILPGDSLITRARNALAAIFLASHCTHLLFVDADCGFRANDAIRLLEAGKDLIGGVCPRKTIDLSFAYNPLQGAETDQDGVLEVAGLGMAFTLMKRMVLERMSLVKRNLKAQGPGYLTGDEQAMHHVFFDCMIHDGYWSEDLTFCHRWRECGGKIHVLSDIKLIHCEHSAP